jgi:hypothetical protein
MADYWLDGNSGTKQSLEPPLCFIARLVEKITGSKQSYTPNLVAPFISTISNSVFRFITVEVCTHLVDRWLVGIAVILIVPAIQSRNDYPLGLGNCKRHLFAELMFLMSLTFAMHRV